MLSIHHIRLLSIQAISLCYAQNFPILRLMAIGDSITIGGNDTGGYRNILFNNLVSQGYNVEFVGSENEAKTLITGLNYNHEGHDGWTINKLSEHSAEILDSVPDPDIILVLIGIEDFIQEDDVENAIHRWDKLIGRIAELRPFTHIFASSLTPHRNADICYSITNKFNNFAKAIVNSHSAASKKATFVDLANVVNLEDLEDDLHPSKKGYEKIAKEWTNAIQMKFAKHNSVDPPEIIRVEGSSDLHHVIITFSRVIQPQELASDNFMIKNLNITSYQLGSDERSVILTTSKQMHGIKYDVQLLQGLPNSRALEASVATSVTFTTGWRFLILSDWHSAEKYIFRHNISDIENDVKVLKHLKKEYGGDLIMIAGDTNAGKWYTYSFRQNLKNLTGKYHSNKETVLEAGNRCYSGMYSSFRSAGYWKLLMSFGDHEAGDNPWKQNSEKSHLLPQYRHIFAKNFNYDYNGKFRFIDPIGAVPSRPVGTQFEETSFAYIHKNVLFVSVDILFQKSPSIAIDGKNTVAGRVNNDHLIWFDSVLAEGQKLPQVNHIFVEGHFPVLYPVRKVKSSGQYMNWKHDSVFWKTMRKNKVDIYFTGEVHLTTVIKDTNSNLIQIASRGNYFSNFLSVDVSDEAVDIISHNEIGDKEIKYNYSYEVNGRLLLNKANKKTTFISFGDLAFLNTLLPMIHFDFEHIVPLQSRQVLGLGDIDGVVNKPIVDAVPVNGIICKYSIPNLGEFGQNYDAQAANIELEDGVHGNAGKFSSTSRAALWGMGPHTGGDIISYALWFKTISPGTLILISYEAIWNKPNVLNLRLRNGVIELCYSQNQKLYSKNDRTGKNLNDGIWHHIAMSMPHKDCFLSEVLVYVDGNQIETTLAGVDQPVDYPNGGVLAIGGFGYGGSKAKHDLFIRDVFRKGDPFLGMIDDVIIWARTLSSIEIEEIVNRGHSEVPSAFPSTEPSSNPTMIPSQSPSVTHSDIPSTSPSTKPSFFPSFTPTTSTPTTSNPTTSSPTTSKPTHSPSYIPSLFPSFTPSTSSPTTSTPTTSNPTTSSPTTSNPTLSPTHIPSFAPSTSSPTTSSPTTSNPSTSSPTTSNPTLSSTHIPSLLPSFAPSTSSPTSSSPTTLNPTTSSPTTSNPTLSLTHIPSLFPSFAPSTSSPTKSNPTTSSPTTSNPTHSPTHIPTSRPIFKPTTSSPTILNPTPIPTLSPASSPAPITILTPASNPITSSPTISSPTPIPTLIPTSNPATSSPTTSRPTISSPSIHNATTIGPSHTSTKN